MKKPDYSWGDKLEFICYGKHMVGYVEIIDTYGTFGQNEEPSYDIGVWKENGEYALYKHIQESWVVRKLPQEPVTRGLLQYDEKIERYSVVYNRYGYAALIDQPFMDLRRVGTKEWIEWFDAPLEEWRGCAVELRNRTVHIRHILAKVDDPNQLEEKMRECTLWLSRRGCIFDIEDDVVPVNGFSYFRGEEHVVVYERPYIMDITYKEIPKEKDVKKDE